MFSSPVQSGFFTTFDPDRNRNWLRSEVKISVTGLNLRRPVHFGSVTVYGLVEIGFFNDQLWLVLVSLMVSLDWSIYSKSGENTPPLVRFQRQSILPVNTLPTNTCWMAAYLLEISGKNTPPLVRCPKVEYFACEYSTNQHLLNGGVFVVNFREKYSALG